MRYVSWSEVIYGKCYDLNKNVYQKFTTFWNFDVNFNPVVKSTTIRPPPTPRPPIQKCARTAYVYGTNRKNMFLHVIWCVSFPPRSRSRRTWSESRLVIDGESWHTYLATTSAPALAVPVAVVLNREERVLGCARQRDGRERLWKTQCIIFCTDLAAVGAAIREFHGYR